MMAISACLAGECCRYDGKSSPGGAQIMTYLEHAREEALLVCPEMLGGLPAPRPRAEIAGGAGGEAVLAGQARILCHTGEDVTEAFMQGAKQALEKILDKNIKKAILKSKSPSCGCGHIYDGTFTGNLIQGNGIMAALLIQNGVTVMTEDQFSATRDQFSAAEDQFSATEDQFSTIGDQFSAPDNQEEWNEKL